MVCLACVSVFVDCVCLCVPTFGCVRVRRRAGKAGSREGETGRSPGSKSGVAQLTTHVVVV